MAVTASVEGERLAFHSIPAWQLTRSQYRGIHEIDVDYTERNLPRRNQDERAGFCANSIVKARNINREVSGNLRRPGQRYTRQRWVIVTKSGEPCAALRTTDNSSSKLFQPDKKDPVSRLAVNTEIALKLHLPIEPFISSRYWVLDKAISGANTPPAALRVAAYLATRHALDTQPVRGYSYTEELLHPDFLRDCGLKRDTDDGLLPVKAFGENPPEAHQATWKAPSVMQVQETLMVLDGVADILKQMHAAA
jgi:hypothetical protein